MASFEEFPEEIWDEIISNLVHDHYLEPLSLVSKTLLSITNRHKKTLNISNETLKFLPSFFHRFPNLKHISFSDYSDNPDQILHQIAEFNFPLETLDLSNHKHFLIEGFDRLPSSVLAGIKSFKIHSNCEIDLENIAYFFPNLEELELGDPISNPKDVFWPLLSYYRPWDYKKPVIDHNRKPVSKLNRIRRIKFRGNSPSISNESLLLISVNCPNLEAIMIQDCPEVSTKGFIIALQACKNIKSIGLIGNPFGFHFFFGSSRMYVNDDFLNSIVEANLPLKRFTLSYCEGVSDQGIIAFLKCYNSLDYLALEGIGNLNDELIYKLAKFLTKTTKIKLNGCQSLTNYALFYLMEHCPLLESVEMGKTAVGRLGNRRSINNDDDRRVYPTIKCINLSYNPGLRDGLLKEIALACPNLEKVKLGSCDWITKKGVGEIMRNCDGLRRLEIDKCHQVSNLGMDTSDTKTYRLESLMACGTQFDGKALLDIAKQCPNLKYMSLRWCKMLTYYGVREVVYRCTKLKAMNLYGCGDMFKDMPHRIDCKKPFIRWLN